MTGHPPRDLPAAPDSIPQVVVVTEAHTGLSGRRRVVAGFAIWLAIMAVSLELMGVNVALPAIALEFGATPSATTWVVKAYQLGVLLALLPLSALGESIGYRVVYRSGLVVYAVAAICCLLAPNLPTLVAFRALQGLGLAGIVSVNGALMRHIFPVDRLARAYGVSALLVGVFYALGPSLVSVLAEFGSWRLIFVVLTPLCLGALTCAFWLPDNQRARGYDVVGALLYLGTVATLFAGSELLQIAPALPAALLALAAAAGLGVTLFRRSLTSPRPVAPVDLLRSGVFLLSVLTSIGAFTAQTAAYIVMPFHMTSAMGRTQLEVGGVLMAWPIAVACAAPLAGRLVGRFSAATLAGCGLALMASGLGLLVIIADDASNGDMVWRLALCGFGFGFFQTPNNHQILTSAPMARAGAAAGMQAIARHTGQIAGAGVAAAVFLVSPHHEMVAMAIAAAIAAAAGAVSLSRRLIRPAQTVPAATVRPEEPPL